MRVQLTGVAGDPGTERLRRQGHRLRFRRGQSSRPPSSSPSSRSAGRRSTAAPLDLQQGGAGSWIGDGTQLSLAGVWNVTALVQTGSKGTEIPMTLVTATPGSTQQVVPTQDGPDIVTTTLATGQSIQAYVDPGTAGTNDVHITAFDEGGEELPLSDVLVVVTPEGGDLQVLDAQRLTPGHFSAPGEFEPATCRSSSSPPARTARCCKLPSTRRSEHDDAIHEPPTNRGADPRRWRSQRSQPHATAARCVSSHDTTDPGDGLGSTVEHGGTLDRQPEAEPGDPRHDGHRRRRSSPAPRSCPRPAPTCSRTRDTCT